MSDKGIPGMGEIFALGHKAVEELFNGNVEITEKIDGSFFSWMMDPSGELRMRSKGQALYFDAPSSKMFRPVMEIVEMVKDGLTPGWIYRGEFVGKPKHNTLAYNSTPPGLVAIFDIETSPGYHLNATDRQNEAHRLGFGWTPVIFSGVVPNNASSIEILKSFLEKESCLGGPKIEGIVIKNYSQFDHGHILMAKLVSEAFKEKHSTEWKKSNPGNKDILENIIEMYRVEARWRKAVQHLAEQGALDNSPKDIGPLLKEVATDVLKEEEDQIKALLWKYAWPKISRGITRGFPEWYKDELLKQQFEGDDVDNSQS